VSALKSPLCRSLHKSHRRRLLPQLRLMLDKHSKAASNGSGEGNAKKSIHYYGSPLAGGGGNTVGGGGGNGAGGTGVTGLTPSERQPEKASITAADDAGVRVEAALAPLGKFQAVGLEVPCRTPTAPRLPIPRGLLSSLPLSVLSPPIRCRTWFTGHTPIVEASRLRGATHVKGRTRRSTGILSLCLPC
jgi:hypothetical protein